MTSPLPKQQIGKSGLSVGRIALGCMGLAGTWNPAEAGPDNVKQAIASFESALEAGIDFFDHADIYGQGACESVFKECLAAVPGIRDKIVVATKCGINSGKYNLSYGYIKSALDASLRRLGTSYVDIYQMHRPDPLAHPRDTARALREAIESGKVRHVAVSNYYPEQVRALQTYLDDIPIVSNQIEISMTRIAPFYEGWRTNDLKSENGMFGDGVLDQCMALDITPLAWSPIGKGYLGGKPIPPDHPHKERLVALVAALKKVAETHDATTGQIALAWLLKHPSGIIPLVGSNNPAHIREAVDAAQITLTREEWYALFSAAWGRNVP
jgi:predicted oxidoreductase